MANKRDNCTRASRVLSAHIVPLMLVMPTVSIHTGLCNGQDLGRTVSVSDQQLLAAFRGKSADELLQEYLRDPPYPLFAIRRIIDLGDRSVISGLERAFGRADRELTRQFLAAALVRLGASHPAYFEYLASGAAVAATSDLPFSVALGSQFDTVLFPVKPKFLSWVRKHGAELQFSLWQAVFDFPAAVEALGEAADPRSRLILLRGLKSPNVLVVFEASLGLARLQDDACVPKIIAAAKRMEHEERNLIAKTLLYFTSAQAQRAAERLIEDPPRLQRWRAEVDGRGWKEAMQDNGHSR